VGILEFVAQSDKPVRLPEIVEKTGLGESTCANIISSLTENGLLDKTGEKRKYSYSIGRKFHELSRSYISPEYVRSIASIAMDNFAEETGVSCILGIVEHQFRIIIHESKPQTRLQVVHHKKYPAYASSMGRFILAHYADDRLKLFLERFGMPNNKHWKEFHDFEDLKEELNSLKQIMMEPTVVEADHVVMMFAPINYLNKTIAAIGLYLPLSNYHEQNAPNIQSKFLNLTEFINSHLKD
jgi:DNA-binding IclR family transcriptional regulator